MGRFLERLGRGVERRLWMLWLPYLALILVGLAGYLAADPRIITPTFAPREGPVEGHLGLLSRGVTVEVSSYDWFRSHHPLFAVDGEARPEGWQMWATFRDDRAPFVEVRLAGPADVERVVLDFVGTGSWPENALPAYTIACFAGEEPVARLAIEGNSDQKPSHAVECRGVDRVRVDFAVRPYGEPFSIVRLYELELWGGAEP